jgi:endonuclease G
MPAVNALRTHLDSIKTWALGTALAAMLVLIPNWAHAGLLSGVLAGAAERYVEHRVEARADKAPVPGLNSPLALPSGEGFAGCAQLFPKSAPLDIKAVNPQWRAVGLCSDNFAVLSSGLSKTPLIVIERLNHAQLQDAGGEERTNEFYPDPRLARGTRAELDDFKGTGYDRGHMSPAADQPNQRAMIQSFALSNMVPQDPFNNRKTWAKIESDTRKYAKRAQGNVFVFSGPIFRGPQKTIGRNKVWVPSHLFKLVYDESTGRAWAFILANTAEARVEAPVDYSEFVRQTGWQVLGGSAAAAASR